MTDQSSIEALIAYALELSGAAAKSSAAAFTHSLIINGDAQTEVPTETGSVPTLAKQAVLAQAKVTGVLLEVSTQLAGAYPFNSIEEGLAATTDGGGFSVRSSDDAVYITSYINRNGVAELDKQYPSAKAVVDLAIGVDDLRNEAQEIGAKTSLAEAAIWSRPGAARALLGGFDDVGGHVELDSAYNPVGGPAVTLQLAQEAKQGILAYQAMPRRALLGGFEDIQGDYFLDAVGNMVEGPLVVQGLLQAIESISGGETGVRAIENDSREPVFIDGGALKIINADGEKVFADISPSAFVGKSEWRGSAVVSATNKASLASRTPVAVSRLNDGYTCVVPSARKVLIVIPSYGQSNSVGAQAYAPPATMTTNPWSDNLLMFDLAAGVADIRMGLPSGGAAVGSEEVLNGLNLVGFKPLKSVQSAAQNNRGATALEGIGFTVQKVAGEYLGFQPDILMFASGYGSRPYRELKKGSIPYSNFMTAMRRAKEIAAAKGLSVYVPFVALVHGEGDSTNLSYATDLVTLQENLQQDILAITGQQGAIPCVCSQASTFFSNEVNGVLDTYKVCKSSAMHALSAPYYPYEMYAGDELHLGNRGLYLGEKMARTILRDSKLWGSKGKGALRPASVSFDGNKTVELVLDVPVPPLVRDASNPVVNNPVPKDAGFEVLDGLGSPVAISAITITGDSIQLLLEAVPASGPLRALRYAMTGYAGTQNGGGVRIKGRQARGQIRDSESTPSIVDGSPMYNWLVHFSESF